MSEILSTAASLARRLRGGERGYTMLIVLGMLVLSTGLIGAVLDLTSSSANNVSQQVARSKAYDAAQAGVGIVLAELNQQPNAWLDCPTQSTPQIVDFDDPNNVADFAYQDAYTYSVIPAYDGGSTQSACVPGNVNSILDTTTNAAGQFRMLFTGWANPTSTSTGLQTVSRNLVVSFSRQSFVRYMWYTNYEIPDPSVLWGSESSKESSTCSTEYYWQSRTQVNAGSASPGTSCLAERFITADAISGPLWSNDSLDICGSPSLGRSSSTDVVEAESVYCDSGSPTPSYDGGSGSLTATGQKTLIPPSNNSDYASNVAANASYGCVFEGPTDIQLSGSTIYVWNKLYNISDYPYTYCRAIYVEPNPGASCTGDTYDPSGAAYDDVKSSVSGDNGFSEYDSNEAGCADAYVSGSYNTSMTIGTAGDIVINGSITNSAPSSAVLGLAATNWVRIYHPMSSLTYNNSCSGKSNGTGTTTNMTIDAAIVALTHSFVLDNYNCGATLGSLTVSGSIAQNYRGPVSAPLNATTITSGYTTAYSYDSLLASVDPPFFPTPNGATWTVARETLCYDGANCATAAG